MTNFVKVATLSELPDGEKMLVEAEERLVILFRTGEEVFCLDDVCTHDGGTLSDGDHSGCEIKCPRHGAKFDIRTGQALSMPATEPTKVHEVRIDGDDILVKIDE